jgi:hypothetical protein
MKGLVEPTKEHNRVEVLLEEPYLSVHDLQFNLTHEGLIVDLFGKDGEIIETSSETYAEIIERLLGF